MARLGAEYQPYKTRLRLARKLRKFIKNFHEDDYLTLQIRELKEILTVEKMAAVESYAHKISHKFSDNVKPWYNSGR